MGATTGRTHLWKNFAFVGALTTTLQSPEYQLVPVPADFFNADPLAALQSALDRPTREFSEPVWQRPKVTWKDW
jgi:hypothetical protein